MFIFDIIIIILIAAIFYNIYVNRWEYKNMIIDFWEKTFKKTGKKQDEIIETPLGKIENEEEDDTINKIDPNKTSSKYKIVYKRASRFKKNSDQRHNISYNTRTLNIRKTPKKK